MIWKLAIAALAGYIIRHLVGIAFKRLFKKRMPDLFGGAELFVNKADVREIIVSFDAGRSWYVRTASGWSKANHDFVKKLLDKNAADNSESNHPSAHPTVS